jgi:hypothetical protein
MFYGNAGSFTGGEHFFSIEVLEHIQFHPQCQKEQVECTASRDLGLCALQLAIIEPLLRRSNYR